MVMTSAKKTTKKTTKVIASEPEPEETEETEIVETKKKFETYKDAIVARKEIDVKIKELMKERATIEKEMDSLYARSNKGKRNKTGEGGAKRKSGVVKKIGMPPRFLKFLKTALKKNKFDEEGKKLIEEQGGYTAESGITRSMITKIIYNYIKHNELYQQKEDGTPDKKHMAPDEAITTLFELQEDEELKFETMQTMIKRLVETSPEYTETATETEEAVVEEAPVKTAKKVSKKVSKKPVVEEVTEDVAEEEVAEEVPVKTSKKATKKTVKS